MFTQFMQWLWNRKQKQKRSAGFEIWTPEKAHALSNEDQATVLDVREWKELEQSGIAKGAVWIATSSIQGGSEAWIEFCAKHDRERWIFVYCAAGVRAGRATDVLQSQGFRAENIGGFSNWIEARLPVEKAKRP